MRSLVLKALSHSLQVEFTYIKTAKQVRFMAEPGIKTCLLSLSATFSPFLPITRAALLRSGCPCVAAELDGKHIAPSIMPIFFAGAQPGACLKPRPHSARQIFLRTDKKLRQTSPSLISLSLSNNAPSSSAVSLLHC